MNESPKWAKPLMVFATLFVPFGVYFQGIHNYSMSVSIHAILWGTLPEFNVSEQAIIGNLLIILARSLFYGIFNIWFGIEVIRYFNNYTRKRAAIVAGALSIVYPIALVIVSWPLILFANSRVYVGPIPIQFVIGLLLMKYFGESKLHEPWSE